MCMVNKLILLLISLLIFSRFYGLQITEIFYKADQYLTSEERFIELYNESSEVFDLSSLVISLPRSDTEVTNLTLSKGLFEIDQEDVQTNSFLLFPGQYAVVMTEDYNKYGHFYSFSSNTILLKPKNKSFSGWSWANRLSLIKISTNGVVLFSCGDYYIPPDNSIPCGKSLSLNGSNYTVSEISPGINNSAFLYSENRIVKEGEVMKIYYRNPFLSSNTIAIDVFSPIGKSFLTLNRIDSKTCAGQFSPSYGLQHGDNIVFKFENNTHLLRYQEKKPRSQFYHKILINEIVTDPKIDYSGGGWSGMDGGGNIDSTDEWLEIVNRTDSTAIVSNYYIYYKSKYSEAIKKISFRTNSNGTKNGVLNGYGYIVVTPEGGMANDGVIYLYDDYPHYKGKIVDYVEYGIEDFEGDGTYNNAPSGKASSREEESISRIPNAVECSNFSLVFKKRRVSLLKSNGSEEGLLWAMDVYGELSNVVYLVDTNNFDSTASVFLENDIDNEILILTNRGIYFEGVIIISPDKGNKGDGVLNVENGIKTRVSYQDLYPIRKEVKEFLWCKYGWNLPTFSEDLSRVLIYPNPVEQNAEKTIVFANIPSNTDIAVYDFSGNVLNKMKSENGKMLEWKTSLKRGIYFVVFKKKSGDRTACSVTKKLLVW